MRRPLFAVILCACAHAAAGGRESLLKADADFARDVEERGLDAWVEAFADDGAMFPAGEPAIRGHDRIRATMEELGDPRRAPPALRVRWKPLGADISDDGTLGWTFGNSLIVSGSAERRGKYVTVWRRAAGGQWKVVADMGTGGEAVPGAGP